MNILVVGCGKVGSRLACSLSRAGHDVSIVDRNAEHFELLDDDFSGITFPGGHVEPREPVIDAMIRELQEETGLTVTHPKLVGIKEWMEEDGDRYIVFLYTADTFSGDLQSSREGEVFWTPLETLLSENCIWHMDSMLKVFTQEYSELFLAGDDYIPVLK